MKNRFWLGLIAAGIVVIGAAMLLTSRPTLFDAGSRPAPQLPTPATPADSLYPRYSVATSTSTVLPPASPTPTQTRTPLPVNLPGGESGEDGAPATAVATATEPVATAEPEAGHPTSTPTLEPSPTANILPPEDSVPAATAVVVLPQPSPTPQPTAVQPAPTLTPTSLPTASATSTIAPTFTPTASATASATRTPTPSPTASGLYSFQVLPTGDFQVFRGGVAQIAGSAPASGIKVYLDGQENRTPAGGKLSSGTVLTVSRQYWQGENVHVTTFGETADLAITQTVSYTAGANYLTLRWDISSSTHPDARFFYAFDSALEGNDLGDPYRDSQSGRIGVWNPGLHSRFMGLQPVSPSPSAYTLGAVNGPNGWAAVEASGLKSFAGSGTDNYLIALEWDNRLRSDTRWTIEVKLTFALSG